jgi:hypothetical protein
MADERSSYGMPFVVYLTSHVLMVQKISSYVRDGEYRLLGELLSGSTC